MNKIQEKDKDKHKRDSIRITLEIAEVIYARLDHKIKA